jgi:transcriptional regulator with XRE-family HTH domain
VQSRNTESLADFVKRIRHEKSFSTTDVERQSRRGGAKGISDAYVTRIENKYVTNVSPEKLKALARGLGESEDAIFAVARGVKGVEPSTLEAEVGILFYGWEDASDEDKKATIEAIKMIAEGFQRRRTRKKK